MTDLTSNREEVESIPEEPKSPKKEKKKEKVPKKEKILKKESVKSMSILSFLKHTKKLEVPPVPIDLCDADPEEKEEGDPTIKTETTSIDVIKEASSSPQSIEELRAELKEQMDKEHQESMKRLEALHQHAKEIVIMREEKTEPGTHPGESQSGQGAQIHSTQSQSLPSEEPSQEDEAVIEMANEFEEDAIVDVTPQMFTDSTQLIKHIILTINKSDLPPSELIQLPHMLGFRYIHPDTDTDAKHVLFGICHRASHTVSGRKPLAQDEHIDYEEDSDDLVEEDEIQGDDCNDTESESGDDVVNQLDYGDGFLAEEDINIGDVNLTAEEKSALVFRSVSGNKGKLNQDTRLSSTPFVASAVNCSDLGVDLHQCKCVIGDPVFFAGKIEQLKKRRLEVAVGEKLDEIETTSEPSKSKLNRKLNMNEEMVREMCSMIQGQGFTISQINDKMQERFPGLPKRQVSLHCVSDV